MTTAFYRWLIALHPAPFRKRFGDEMYSIFEDAKADGVAVLLLDATTSLARQWLLRSGLWKVAAALTGAALQLAFAGIAWRELFAGTAGQISDPEIATDQGMLLLLSAGLTVAVLMGIVSMGAWNAVALHRAGRSVRRRRP